MLKAPNPNERLLKSLKLFKKRFWDKNEDQQGQRRIWSINNELHADDFASGKSKLLAEFPKLTFEEVTPPDWAKEW